MNAEGGQSVFQAREERDSSELGGKGGGYGFSGRIPLKDVAPGLYVVRLEAESRVGDRQTASRETIVNVIPGPAGASNQPSPAGATPAAPPPAAPAAPPPPAPVIGTVAMTTINSNHMSGIDTPQQSVARTAGEFETLWRRHAPSQPLPAVDFGKQMVLAVFLGSRPSGGFNVQITNVQSFGKDLVVQWVETRPAPGMSAATVMTSPAHLVTVPQTDGAVRFEKQER
jgi:PrcB C-terminal